MMSKKDWNKTLVYLLETAGLIFGVILLFESSIPNRIVFSLIGAFICVFVVMSRVKREYKGKLKENDELLSKLLHGKNQQMQHNKK